VRSERPSHDAGFRGNVIDTAVRSSCRLRYEDALLITGLPTGTPQEALDTACTILLADLGHEPAS
jgi:hypothetical protein